MKFRAASSDPIAVGSESQTMRPASAGATPRNGLHFPLGALALAAFLAAVVWSLQRERQRILADFASAQRTVAEQIRTDLAGELHDLDDDARLVAALVRQADGKPVIDSVEGRAFILSGFEALATVVRHYRAIMLFRGAGLSVNAIDPTEPAQGAAAFVDWGIDAASSARQSKGRVLLGPREGREGRQYFVYAQPATGEDEGAVVLISEARLLLQPVLRSRASRVQYFLIDPSGSIWLGCDQLRTCRAFTQNEWPSIPGLVMLSQAIQTGSEQLWTADALPVAFGLGPRLAALSWNVLEHGGRQWKVGVVASAQPLEVRERSLLDRLIGTSVALVFALGAFSTLVIRHQKRSTALRERLRHAQEVAHLRERTEKLIDNVSAGFIGVTRDGRVAFTNRFLRERVLPVPEGARVAEVLSNGDDAAADRFSGAIADALRSGRPGFFPGHQIRAFANRPGHFDLRIIPLKQPADDVSVLLLVEDLSEIKSLEKQLVRAEKLGTVGVLTAGLAHEIGTPLSIIRGRAELLLAKIVKSAEPGVAKDIESVIRQIDQIGTTIRQVLDFARAQPVEIHSVDPNQALESALSILDWRLRRKALSARIDCPPGVAAIAADPDQLQQVLVNLLINAVDACEPGGSIRVGASATSGARAVKIEISDDGCGIAPEDLNAVFDPFFTTKKRGEGTGLGLSVASSIVRNHHGELSLLSRKGEGTTVTILWPIAEGRIQTHG